MSINIHRNAAPGGELRSALKTSFSQATLMTTLAGFVDAVGYSAMGHLYVSFMSGNSTQLGMAIARRDLDVVGWAGAVIAAFVLGAFLGALIDSASGKGRLSLVFACEFLCLVLALSLDGILPERLALLFVASAMGMQNAVHEAVAGVATGKSFITGALFGIGDALARACRGKASFLEAGVNAVSWVAFVSGVTIGALAVLSIGVPSAIAAAAAVVLVLMFLSA